jgi:hypothetical protein
MDHSSTVKIKTITINDRQTVQKKKRDTPRANHLPICEMTFWQRISVIWPTLCRQTRYYSQFAARDTIYALSSGAVKSGVAVIRVSGPGCKQASHHMNCNV